MLQKKERSLAPLHSTQRAGHVQLELVADWRVACVEEDLAALLPPYGVAVVVCVERKGIRVPITRGPAVIITSLHNYLIKTYSVNHPSVTTRFGGREIGLLD